MMSRQDMAARLSEALDCWSDYMPSGIDGISQCRLGLESVILALMEETKTIPRDSTLVEAQS